MNDGYIIPSTSLTTDDNNDNDAAAIPDIANDGGNALGSGYDHQAECDARNSSGGSRR